MHAYVACTAVAVTSAFSDPSREHPAFGFFNSAGYGECRIMLRERA